MAFKITPPYYPIVYVRGYAATHGEREDTFYDTYYGYAATAVEKRNAPPPLFLEPVVFEGQLIRFIKEYGYVDAANGGLPLAAARTRHNDVSQDPTRSIWVSRFYDPDVMSEKVRPIEDHAADLFRLITETIPAELKRLTVVKNNQEEKAVEWDDAAYKVILVAHSMGGLVCRCLLQNLKPIGPMWDAAGKTPAEVVHKLVTIGTPHGGIELSAVPDLIEDFVAGKNPFGAAIFKEPRMREYLNLEQSKADAEAKKLPLNSLNGTFPEGRCLSVIGSDHGSYGAVRKATGSFSDGLVRQNRAYIRGAYWANVHRAHSGRRGIVNSFETYENVRRFLFGDVRVRLWLEDITIAIAPPGGNVRDYYDFEFALSVRGTGVVLHRRTQDPCENAIRLEHAGGKLYSFSTDGRPLDEPPAKGVEVKGAKIHLHTGFLDTKLQTPGGDGFSRFLLAFRVVLHRVKERWGFDTEYPARTVYSETLELQVALDKPPAERVQYRWLSDTTDPDSKNWEYAGKKPADGGVANGAGFDEQAGYRFPLRKANSLDGVLCIKADGWGDDTSNINAVGYDAAQDAKLT